MKQYTVLEDRVLWFDGSITIDPSDVFDHISHLDKVFVTNSDDTIDQYNKFVSKKQKIAVKTSNNNSSITPTWNIPEQYQELDVYQHIRQQHIEMFKTEQWSQTEWNNRQQRINDEFEQFENKQLLPLLRTLIFIINTMKQHDKVWGTGRGSSVSSYVLFVLEVHDVDSFFYNINFTDFIK